LISAPAANVDATIVYGVNHEILNDSHQIVSNASCTTNCLAPLIKNIHDKLTVESGIMTTIHSYTNDQVLTDVYHSDLRRARSATQSMIPAKTGAASAVGLVLPELNGKLDGFAIRVPTINVSLVDLCINVKKESSLDEINSIIKKASENELSGILGYNSEPLVSIDFNHSSFSSVYDESLSRVMNNKFFKICSWYDNEWGFSNRMLDVAKILARN
jgi:glyceraldehyde 3-phosphate dehydrogenase